MNGGTLQWNGTNPRTFPSRIVMLSGKTATLDTNGNTVHLASTVGSASSGSLTKAGAGILSLDGTVTYTGATTINAGTLR